MSPEGEYLAKAAEVIATAARIASAKFSKRIGPATHVVMSDDYHAAIVTDPEAAPNAAPFQFAESHPLFGDTAHWYKMRRRPYMTTAKRKTPQALEVYAELLDVLAAEHGYNE